MKVVAALMVLIGLTIGAGGAAEFGYYGPEWRQFWVGVFATPAGAFFAVAGMMLWGRGLRARRTVLLAALVMFGATVAATLLQVMGPPATIMGMIGVLVAIGWFWRTRHRELSAVNGNA